jgi:hypothetical protein
MSLAVEVAGYGLSQHIPVGVFIICVQQESYQAWTVYRQYSNFQELSEQMQILHPGTEVLPLIEGSQTDIENLEQARVIINNWLQAIVMNPLILRTQSMYQFLCSDANVAPPHLEVHWRTTSHGSFDEMEMEEMFDKEHDDTGDMSFEDNFESGDAFDEDDLPLNNSNHGKSTSSHSARNKSHIRRPSDLDMEENDKDGFDIQSISMVEAEFMYDKDDVEVAPTKRTINLDAFNIIKVIGKGTYSTYVLTFTCIFIFIINSVLL